MTGIEQPEFETMGVSDWIDYLREHDDRCLVVNAPDGVHTFHYAITSGTVSFFEGGRRRYDEEDTRTALGKIVGESEGLRVQTIRRTYGEPARPGEVNDGQQ